MKKPIIGILDYGAGNTLSVKKTVDSLNFRSRLVTTQHDFSNIALLLIPGVGAFGKAMEKITQAEMIKPIQAFAQQGYGIIGVCLGMQLLANESCENGHSSGLGLIPGEVVPIQQPKWHIGWNTLETTVNNQLINLQNNSYFYFNHAYEFKTNEQYVISYCNLQRKIVSAVQKDNVIGFQFHPEKSQTDGMLLIHQTVKALLHA